MDVSSFFVSFTALILGVTVIAEFVDKLWHLDGVSSQVRSLFVGIGLGEIGAGFHMGFFADPAVLGTMAWYLGGAEIGLGAGIAANWSFALPGVQWFLAFLKLRPPADNPPS